MGYTVGATYWIGQFFICLGMFKVASIDNINIKDDKKIAIKQV
jgi:hypothetical protein